MDSNKIANILYNMCVDMDQLDYIENLKAELNLIENEIENLKTNDSILYNVLFLLASNNDI